MTFLCGMLWRGNGHKLKYWETHLNIRKKNLTEGIQVLEHVAETGKTWNKVQTLIYSMQYYNL